VRTELSYDAGVVHGCFSGPIVAGRWS